MMRVVCSGGERLEYLLIRSRRADVLIRALPEGETRVYAPERAHLREVDEMVRARIPQLKRMHRELDRQLAENRLRHPVSADSRICVEGDALRLVLRPGARTAIEIDAGDCVLTLDRIDDEAAVRAALRAALSQRMLARVRERLAYFAPRIGADFGRVTVRDQKTRWGSCSSKRNLNFNWKLIMAPREALDYVVIHELCHLIEFNHSARFWKLVEAQMPEYEIWKKWLKAHGGELGV